MSRLVPACCAAFALQCAGQAQRVDVRNLIRADQQFMERSLGRLVREGLVDPYAAGLYRDYMEAERDYLERWEHHVESLWALNARPDATREEFDGLLATIRVDRTHFAHRTVRFLSDMHAELEPEQWSAVQDHLRRAEREWRKLSR